MMDDLERRLSEALRREDPSGSFEARVMAAVAREQDRRRAWIPGGWRWATALAMTVVAVFGVQKYRERAAGEEAKARLELALRITSEKLRKIQQQVNAEDQ